MYSVEEFVLVICTDHPPTHALLFYSCKLDCEIDNSCVAIWLPWHLVIRPSDSRSLACLLRRPPPAHQHCFRYKKRVWGTSKWTTCHHVQSGARLLVFQKPQKCIIPLVKMFPLNVQFLPFTFHPIEFHNPSVLHRYKSLISTLFSPCLDRIETLMLHWSMRRLKQFKGSFVQSVHWNLLHPPNCWAGSVFLYLSG